jgi:NADPH:quinone reductase-like Zn-dependent oxidoreductase
MVFPETGPFVPGCDMAGVVVDIGTGGSGRATGRSPPACRLAAAIQRTQQDRQQD